MTETWFAMLRDLESDFVRTAAADLCSETEFPPSVSQLRRRAAELSMGTLAPLSGLQAWDRACRASCDDSIVLTDTEAMALRIIGGKWALKNNPHADFMRRDFVKGYEELLAERFKLASSLPSVKRIAMENTPKLPPMREGEASPAVGDTMTKEKLSDRRAQISAMLANAGLKAPDGVK